MSHVSSLQSRRGTCRKCWKISAALHRNHTPAQTIISLTDHFCTPPRITSSTGLHLHSFVSGTFTIQNPVSSHYRESCTALFQALVRSPLNVQNSSSVVVQFHHKRSASAIPFRLLCFEMSLLLPVLTLLIIRYKRVLPSFFHF